MRTAVAHLVSISPYSQSRASMTPKLLDKDGSVVEGADDFERRTWRDRLHVNDEGFIFIPPMAFKNCLSEAAKFLSESVPGKGKATWTKHFEAGVLVVTPLVLPLKKDDCPGEWLFVPADGRRGGGKRVMKQFPVIHKWEGDAEFLVLDDRITSAVFDKHIRAGGSLIGIGRFRPRNNGFYGRVDR